MEPQPASLDVERLLADAAWIRRLAGRLVGDDSEADDLAQETLLAALRHPPAQHQPLRPWLVHVLRNFLYRASRRDAARRSRERVAASARTSVPSPAELLERADTQRAVVETVVALREPYRSVLLLRYYEGLTSEQIAAARGMPSGTVRSLLARGIREVRAELDARTGGKREAWVFHLTSIALATPPNEAGVAPAPPSRARSLPIAAVAATTAVVAVGTVFWLAWSRDRASLEPTGVAVARRDDSAAAAGAAGPDASARTGADPTRPVVVSAAEAPRAPLTALVRDWVTKEPVPRLAVEVRDRSGHRESLLTDANGRFATSERFAAGAVEVVLSDFPGGEPLRALEHLHEVRDDAAEPTFDVPLGPTFSLELRSDAALPPTGFVCLLSGRVIENAIHAKRQRYFADPVAVHPGRLPVESAGAGANAWVRFGPKHLTGLTLGNPWRLSIAAADGTAWAEAEVGQVRGIQRGDVVVRLAPAGDVAGTVTLATGGPAVDVSVALKWPAQEVRAGIREGTIGARTGSDGRYRFRAVPPGAYTLHASSIGTERSTMAVAVEPGKTTSVDVALRAVPDAGTIHGAVRSRSGAYEPDVEIRFCLEKDLATIAARARVEWGGPPGARVGRFTSPPMRPGRYWVLPKLDRDFDWSPRKELATTGQEAPVDLECIDDAPRRDVVLRAYDASTGSRIPLADAIYITVPLIHHFQRDLEFGATWERDLPKGKPFEWSVRAEGFRPASGRDEQIREEGGRGVLEVHLERGWGVKITLFRSERERLAGVKVLADGVEAGESDAMGEVSITLDRRPRRLEFRHPECDAISDFHFDAETGEYQDDDWTLMRVLMPPRAEAQSK